MNQGEMEVEVMSLDAADGDGNEIPKGYYR